MVHLRRWLLAPIGRSAWLCLLLVTGGGAQVPVPAALAKDDADVVLLHINDFHGQFRPLEALWRERPATVAPELVGGAAALAGYVQRSREIAAAGRQRVVVTDAGDWFQGTLEGNTTKGSLAVEFLNRLGLDGSVIGNHEYDFGDANLRRLIAAATFPVLGANLLAADSKTRTQVDYARPFHVVDVHGLRLVLVGLTSADTRNVSTGPFGDVVFEQEESALRAVLPAARAAGDVVVLITHCGLEVDKRIAAAFPEIPLILGGHSHTPLRAPFVVGATWIVQNQGKATSVQRIEAKVRSLEKRLELRRSTLVELDLGVHAEDPSTADWIRERTRDLAAKWDRVLGELATPMLDERGVHSTAAGNWMCDTMRAATGADLAFSNKGSIRARLRPGPLTPRHLYELMPFDNTYVSMTLTGAEVRALLAATVRPGRRLLDIGGGSYHYGLVDGERVLRTIRVAGELLRDDADYRVVVSSFLANGGDAYPQLTAGRDRRDHGELLRDLLIRTVERVRRVVVDITQRVVCDDNR